MVVVTAVAMVSAVYPYLSDTVWLLFGYCLYMGHVSLELSTHLRYGCPPCNMTPSRYTDSITTPTALGLLAKAEGVPECIFCSKAKKLSMNDRRAAIKKAVQDQIEVRMVYKKTRFVNVPREL